MLKVLNAIVTPLRYLLRAIALVVISFTLYTHRVNHVISSKHATTCICARYSTIKWQGNELIYRGNEADLSEPEPNHHCHRLLMSTL